MLEDLATELQEYNISSIRICLIFEVCLNRCVDNNALLSVHSKAQEVQSKPYEVRSIFGEQRGSVPQ